MFQVRLAVCFAAVVCSILAETRVAVAQHIERIEANEAQIQLLYQVPISAEVAATIVSVHPDEEGIFVKKGDELIRLNDAVVQAEVMRARTQATQTTEIIFAKTSLESAQANLDQKVQANKKVSGAFTQPEMRAANLEVAKADAQLKKSEDDHILHDLDAKVKEAQLAQYTVKAPFDGLITKISRYAGQNVRPGDPVLTLTDMSTLRAIVSVHFKHRQKLFVGNEVEIRVNASGKPAVTQAAEPVAPLQNPGSIFDEKGGPSASEPANFQPASTKTAMDESQVFMGKIQFIEPTVEKDSTGAYMIKLSVFVTNQQDEHGRFLLQEGMPVQAVILAKPLRK